MIEVKNLIKNFGSGEVVTRVLRGINLHIKKGEFVAIMGKSGAGKSTLLYQMSILDVPTSGEVILDGINTENFSEKERTNFRLNRLGYIFQDYALIPELSAAENVLLPILMLGTEKHIAKEQAMAALDAVGLAHRHDNLPSQLSGGEQQRVSIARAIAHTPDILFADEPTANLDSASGEDVMRVINELHKRNEQTIVMVTHEPEYAAYADRLIEIQDGMVVSDTQQKGNH
ncbi:ABC transporter ATP-binding protein [Candidatus Campbellbacteria bacterium]|nr:MAG: ABC transporter ATP-binding protein [Candidatus Campbellbacteria bacterium]